MTKNLTLTERMLDAVLPLVLLLVTMTMLGKGLPSFMPVVAGTVYSVLQPFFRFFLFDRLRRPMFAAGQHLAFFAGAGVLYSALAIGIGRHFS